MTSYPGKAGHDRDDHRLRRGDIVRCERPDGRPKGTWPRYEGREAVVLIADNRTRAERTRNLRSETGVSFNLAAATNPNAGNVDSWFVAAKLVYVRAGTGKATRGRTAEALQGV